MSTHRNPIVSEAERKSSFTYHTVRQVDPMTTEDKPIKVMDTNDKYLSHCSRKRANQMIRRKKARWIGRDTVELLFNSQDEKKVRKEVLERDGYICYICEGDIDPHAKKYADNELTFDHITPRMSGGTDFADNIAVCCRKCNEEKASLHPEEYVLLLYKKVLLLLGGYKYE